MRRLIFFSDYHLLELSVNVFGLCGSMSASVSMQIACCACDWWWYEWCPISDDVELAPAALLPSLVSDSSISSSSSMGGTMMTTSPRWFSGENALVSPTYWGGIELQINTRSYKDSVWPKKTSNQSIYKIHTLKLHASWFDCWGPSSRGALEAFAERPVGQRTWLSASSARKIVYLLILV